MGRVKKVKVVMFVSPVLALRYTELAEKYGISRSELYRMTLERGYRSTLEWCGRQQEASLGARRGRGLGRPRPPKAVLGRSRLWRRWLRFGRTLRRSCSCAITRASSSSRIWRLARSRFGRRYLPRRWFSGSGRSRLGSFVNGLVSEMFAQSAEGGAESLELGDDVRR